MITTHAIILSLMLSSSPIDHGEYLDGTDVRKTEVLYAIEAIIQALDFEVDLTERIYWIVFIDPLRSREICFELIDPG